MGKSTLSISAALAVIAVILTSLWVGYGPRPPSGGAKQAATVVPLSQQQRTTDSNGQPIRIITTGPSSGSAQRIASPSPSGESSGSASSATNPAVKSPSTETVSPSALADIRSPAKSPEDASTSGLSAATTTASPVDQSAATAGSVDLNSASVEQLNALGAGMIGKRIIEFRPYTSVDDLLARRVLKRSDYEAVRGAVTIR
ncbi:ComEA family DNA-binding protein [Methylobacterium sp. J-072]|uniref:ComEA family DNA-binding protein n=1 Tax=Methylobacterium sp. J-072 TaxID=2836651 RepID=UPI0028BD340A|nr:helix-hairpin-helix domain-containing protein [Methylobacterium sp. J-072]